MKKSLSLLFAAALLAAGGCAPKNWNHEEDGPFDPFEGFNRLSYKFNKGMDFILYRPVAVAYSGLPSFMRTGVSNVFDNLHEPTNALNNAFRKDGDASVNSIARFTFNTVLGVGGLIDVADMMKIPHKRADFGQTLRGYGLNNTAYFYLPLGGPSTFADSMGNDIDTITKPHYYIRSDTKRSVVFSVQGTNARANLLDATDLIEDIALDEYLLVRDTYEDQRRHSTPTRLWGK